MRFDYFISQNRYDLCFGLQNIRNGIFIVAWLNIDEVLSWFQALQPKYVAICPVAFRKTVRN